MPKRGEGYNEKSISNLKQYQRPEERLEREAKKTAAKYLDYLSDAELEIITPTKTMFDVDEQKRFIGFLDMYLKQFVKVGELETTDLVAIATLCKNHILESRILNELPIADAMTPVEKLKKENDRLTEQLAGKRSQRVDPRSNQDFTLQDLLLAYEDKKKEDIEEKKKRFQQEEEKFEGLIKSSFEDMIT